MTWCTSDDGKYRIESISAATFPGALQVMREGFIPNSATCIALEVDKDDLAVEELLELCADAALDSLSLVVVATDTEEVAATVFCKLQEKPTQGSTEKTFFEIFNEDRCKRPSTKAMMDFTVERDAKCNYFDRYGVDCICEIMYLGTKPQHRQKGLAKLLIKTAVELAKKFKEAPITPLTVADLGPKYAFMKPRRPVTKPPQLCTALWSAAATKKCGDSLGFTALEIFSYDDLIYDGKYRIVSISSANFPAALKVARTCFLDETVCIATGVDKDPLAAEEMLELCADAALDGLSLVAIATDTGEVVATVFCKVEEKPMPDCTEKIFLEVFKEERCKRPASRFMMQFMIELDEKCNYFERCGVDCCCEIMFVGTLPHHRRKGLATLLVKTAVELVKKFKNGPIAPLTIADLGPNFAFMKPKKPITKAPQLCTALWSAVGSKRIGQILGFSVVISFSFADFVYDGIRCSDKIGTVTTCEGAVLKI